MKNLDNYVKAIPDFPKPGIPVEGQVLGQVDGLSGQAGPGQVTGVAGINVDICKTIPHIGQLPVTTGGQQGVILAVEAAEDIALSLAMADQINFSHNNLT